VTFSAGTVDQGTALDDSVLRGFVLEGSEHAGGAPTTHSVYFQPDSAAGVSIVRKWIFPSITGSVTDTFTFATTSASQIFTNKIITTGQIYVGTAASKNTFVNSNNINQQFMIGLATTFPTISVLTPQLRLPALNTSEPLADRHTFMMLNASIANPFTIGSIAHGNHDGSEMEMLPASTTNGRALRWNNGESIAACTWTNGTTTIFGAFTTANTRPGMRVRGNTGTSIVVDEFTRVMTVTNGLSITVDTPLIGNSISTTCQTWGPTWDFELAGVDHGSLTGLNDDDHLQYLYLVGRAGGQVLGSGAHTGANITDLTIEGRLMLGDGLSAVNYTNGRALDIRHAASNNTALVLIQNTANTPASGVASGTLTMLLVQPNSPAYTSGSYVFRGLNFTMNTIPSPSGVTVSSFTSVFVQASPQEGGDPGAGGTFGSITAYRGQDFNVQGTSVPANRTITAVTNGTTALTSAGLFVAPIAAGQVILKSDVPSRTTIASITDASNIVMSQAATGSTSSTTSFFPISTELIGNRMLVSSRSKPFTTASFIQCLNATGGNTYIVDANILEVSSTTPFDTTGVATWSLLKLPTTVSNPGTVWVFNISAVNNSRHAGMFSIGKTATPIAWVDLGAGTTTVGPLAFTAGTNKTTAASGDVEYDGSYWYLTHSDAVRSTSVTQRGAVNATAQAAAIGVTTLYTPPAAGYYVVHYTIEDTTADLAAGTIQFQVNYTDDIGATTQVGAALVLTATGRDRGAFQVWSNSGVISYQTNLVGIIGTSRYALRVRLESLG
jgi:hypothetical protein